MDIINATLIFLNLIHHKSSSKVVTSHIPQKRLISVALATTDFRWVGVSWTAPDGVPSCTAAALQRRTQP